MIDRDFLDAQPEEDAFVISTFGRISFSPFGLEGNRSDEVASIEGEFPQRTTDEHSTSPRTMPPKLTIGKALVMVSRRCAALRKLVGSSMLGVYGLAKC